MKKVLLTITLAAFAFAANAQIIVGGNLGFNAYDSKSLETTILPGGTTTVETINPRTFNLHFMPKIGYQIDDNMSAGIILGYSMDKRRTVLTSPTGADAQMFAAAAMGNLTDYAGTRKWSATEITIQPYFRYTLMEFNEMSLFAEASVPVTIHPAEETLLEEEGVYGGSRHTVEVNTLDNKSLSIGVNITPGLNYTFNDWLNLDVYFNALSLGYTLTKITTSNDNYENNDEVTTVHDFGFNVHTLPAPVSFGINFVF